MSNHDPEQPPTDDPDETVRTADTDDEVGPRPPSITRQGGRIDSEDFDHDGPGGSEDLAP